MHVRVHGSRRENYFYHVHMWYTACTTSFLIRIFIVFAVGRSKICRRLQRPINTIGASHDQKDDSHVKTLVKTNVDSLVVTWNYEKGTWSRFHYCWLRDNCQCVKCYNPATGKRLLTTQDDQPDSIQFDNEGVEIKWKDGHSSQFILSWLLENI